MDKSNAIIKTQNNSLIIGCKNTIIPTSITSIGSYAFSNCKALKSITIPSSVESIRSYAFIGATSLTAINIPKSVRDIGTGVFQECSSLEAITIEDGNPKFDSREQCNAIIRKEGNILVKGCKNTKIPDTITRIGEWAFSKTTFEKDTIIHIPDGVKSIDKYAFSDCVGIKRIYLPHSIIAVRAFAFLNCPSLQLRIPHGTRSRFEQMDGMKNIIYREQRP